MDKQEYHVVSFSGGKDSTAMLLKMLELGMKVDCILFCDTGLEFPDMYTHIEQVEKHINRKITIVKAKEDYEYLMLEKPIKRKQEAQLTLRYGFQPKGYGWAGPKMRWCTEKLKSQPRERFLRELRKEYDIIEYVGLAADEGYRLKRLVNQRENHRHPLIDWEMTEADCLQFCYERGFTWNGLYKYFDRVSCWCCPLQSLTDLRILYKHFPDLWAKLKEWDDKTWRDFKTDYSVAKLAARFDLEEEFIRDGRPINNRVFFDALKERMNG
ncbi:MAG: phosphoadenosine phosphosulfate reductase family protein [Clostridia bacterium]|nr:phosphoadenosine phosphosulfate reductase family protein [Clostridia bacterium]